MSAEAPIPAFRYPSIVRTVMRPIDLPRVNPTRLSRRITANEVVRLSHLEEIPGLDMNDPRVEAIRRAKLTNPARVTMGDARRNGYLFVNRTLYDDSVDRNMELLWSWWCSAAGHPEVVLIQERTDLVRIRADVSTAGTEWTLDDFGKISELVAELAWCPDARWLFTPDELQLDDIPMEDAIHIARGLVDLTTAGRLRPGSERRSEAANPRSVPVQHQTPTERSDWRGGRR